MSYEQAYKDHKYLWGIGAANDMTGAYVDSEDLFKMLKNPTKKMAEYCLTCQIEYWFMSGPDIMGEIPDYPEITDKYPNVEKILERYNPSYIW